MNQSYKQIPRKVRILACWCSLVGRKFFHAEFATKLQNALNKIPEMFVNCKQSSYLSHVFNLQKVTFFSFIQLIW